MPKIRHRVVAATGVVSLCAISGRSAAAGVEPPVSPTVLAATLPQIPDRTFRVIDYGAIGDGLTKNTISLQKAIYACGQAGGGTVVVPSGRFLTGPLTFVSRMNLHLDAGAVLLLSDDRADFKLTNNRYENAFSANDAHDISVTGSGTIDGQGAAWWARFSKKDTTAPHRPFLVVLSNCRRVLISGVTLTNSPMFHLVPQRCQDVTIEGIHIKSPEKAPNTDGIDPSGWRFHIAGCTFDTGDDDIALKPGGRIDPDQPACKDFLIENCTFLHGHGMSVGGQTPGGLDGMTVRNCTFADTDAGIRLKAPRGQGGLVENLTYENLTMQNVKVPVQITSFYNGNSPTPTHIDPGQDPAQAVSATTPIWRHIVVRNVTATGAAKAGELFGLAEMPIEDVTFDHVHITARSGMQIVHAKGIRFDASTIDAQSGPPVSAVDADVKGLATSGD